MCMKVAHFYPGMYFKAYKIPTRVLQRPQAWKAIEQASEVLGRNVREVCYQEGYFRSIREGAIVTIALQVAYGRYYQTLQKYRPPTVITGSSLGNYPALIMAGSIGFRSALDVVSQVMGMADTFYRNYTTFLIKGIPLEAVKTFAHAQPEYTIMGHSKREGTAVTFQYRHLHDLASFIQTNSGNSIEVPKRIKFHVPLPHQIKQAIERFISNLHITPPLIDYISTHTATMVESPGEITEILVNFSNSPAQILATSAELVDLGIERNIYFETTGIREGK